MLPSISSNHLPSGRWADAGLFHGVATEAARRCPRAVINYGFERIAPYFSTRTPLAPSTLMHELREACLDAVGPAGTFDIYANCFVGHSSPMLIPLLTAPNAPSLVRRLHAVESLTPRVATTILTAGGDSWIDLRQRRNDDTFAATISYSVGYWGMIIGVFAAAGYRDLVLTSQDTPHTTTVFAEGALFDAAQTVLPTMRCARLSWRKGAPCAPVSTHSVTTVGESDIIGRIELAISNAIERGSQAPSLEKLAALTHRSARSVQRDLVSSWTTLRDIRTSVRMGRASLLLAQSNTTLAEVAFNSGFSDAPHLVREFRRVVGLTPERYRTIYRL